MARKKARKKAKKVVRRKKKISRKKKVIRRKKIVRKAKEKVLGMIDHFFGKISVAAIKVKAPIKVGDVIHVKGHTTDFAQRVDSVQIEHQNVMRAKKGDDIGIKVKEKVRQHDVVYLAAKQIAVQKPMFPAAAFQKPASRPAAKPLTPPPKKSGSSKPYSNTKFFRF